MPDVLTKDGGVQGTNKTFSLSTANTLFGSDPHGFGGIRLYGAYGGRLFSPTRVTISYGKMTRVRVFNQGLGKSGVGSVTFYDPNSIKGNIRPYDAPKNYYKKVSAMPAWLAALVTPNI